MWILNSNEKHKTPSWVEKDDIIIYTITFYQPALDFNNKMRGYLERKFPYYPIDVQLFDEPWRHNGDSGVFE